MYSFIALTKRSSFQTMGTAALQIDSKQKLQQSSDRLFPKLTEDIIQSISKILAELGFQQGTAQASVDEPILEGEQVSNFMPLNYLGAYVVSSSDEKRIQDAQKLFDKSDYDVIRDVRLSLPKPTCSERVYRRRKRVVWPVESGIHQAHSNGITGEGVLVGVLDTGCDADHMQFRQKGIDFRYISPSSKSDSLCAVRGFDVDGHGTHVCGIIAGRHIGVAPGADLMVASVIENNTYQTSLSRISIALDWMLSQFGTEENSGKRIIVNMSLGFRPEYLSKSEQQMLMVGIRGFISTLVGDFDVLPVVAIGNEESSNMRAPGYFPETLSVGAINFHHEPARFSGGGLSPINREVQPDIAGYGVDIFSSLGRDPNNRSLYKYMSGTSMAAPYVAGIAALYASADAKFRGELLRQHLINTALPLQASADRVGAGLARFTDGNENP